MRGKGKGRREKPRKEKGGEGEEIIAVFQDHRPLDPSNLTCSVNQAVIVAFPLNPNLR